MPSETLGYYKTFLCKNCGKECVYWITPSSIKGGKKFIYCSRKCAGSRLIKPEIPCGFCGKMFHSIKNTKYCSRQCFSISTRGRIAKNSHPEHIKEYIKTKYPISDPVDIANHLNMSISAVRSIAYKMGLKIRKDIKRNTLRKAVSHHMMGENNPNWQGGKTAALWGNNWKEQRKKARNRDDYKCQICGYWSRFIPVHHIKPRRLFSEENIEASNDLSNLICLCAKHHVLVEMSKIQCPIPKA